MDISNILYSLIPLILIIVFSWLFSFLGSKMKKQADQGSEPAGRQNSSLVDILTGGKGEDYIFGSGNATPDESGRAQRAAPADWRTYRDPQGPTVSSRPINPKWWGA